MSGEAGSQLTTHVLNTAQGIPAKGLTLTLSKHDSTHGKWLQLSRRIIYINGCQWMLRQAASLDSLTFTHLASRRLASVTNEDGRCPGLLRGECLAAGTYQLRFDTGDYWKQMQQESFYPYVEIVFTITDSKQKYHVPLLLSPYSYTTYRGS